MKFYFALLVIAYFIALSSATLNMLKPRSRTAAFLQPLMRYRTVRILPPPPVIPQPVPVPVVYSAPVSTYSAHVSSYSSSTLPPTTYTVPVPLYSGSATTYGGSSVYGSISAYAAPTVITYRELVPPFPDAIPLFDIPVLEEYYSREMHRRKH